MAISIVRLKFMRQSYLSNSPIAVQVVANFTIDHEQQQSWTYRHVKCQGQKKALLIGINYFGQRGQLHGCIDDVRNMAAYLNEHFGYKCEDVVMLTDDQQRQLSIPTKENILRAMHWLVKTAQPNDSLFFYYSGT